MGRDTDDERIVLVLLVEDVELDGRWRSRVDRVVMGRVGRGGRALAGQLGGVCPLLLDAFCPDVGRWGFQGGRRMAGWLLRRRRVRLFCTLGVGLVWGASRRDHSDAASVSVALRVTLLCQCSLQR